MLRYSEIIEDVTIISSYKSRDIISLQCDYCIHEMHKSKKYIQESLYRGKKHQYCSLKCTNLSKITSDTISCSNCNNLVLKRQSAKTSVSNNYFCSKSCAATYNNKNKKHGTKRSKLEFWLETRLVELYPNLEIQFNSKQAIGSELDIYFPSVKVAIELNGIFHYEPIFGTNKLEKIQNNDNNKFQTCQNKGISLCIIDTSSQKYVKEKSSQKFLDIIIKILDQKLVVGTQGFEP